MWIRMWTDTHWVSLSVGDCICFPLVLEQRQTLRFYDDYSAFNISHNNFHCECVCWAINRRKNNEKKKQQDLLFNHSIRYVRYDEFIHNSKKHRIQLYCCHFAILPFFLAHAIKQPKILLFTSNRKISNKIFTSTNKIYYKLFPFDIYI